MKSLKYIIAITIASLISTCAFAQEEQSTDAAAPESASQAKQRKAVDATKQPEDMSSKHPTMFGDVVVLTRLVDRRINVAIELIGNGVEGSSEDKIEAICEAVTNALADTVFNTKTSEILELLRSSAKNMAFAGAAGNINIAVQLDMDKDPLHLGIWGSFPGTDMPDNSIIAPDELKPVSQ